MPSTYTPRNRAEKQATGEGLNVWGQNLNQRTTDLFDEALDGVESVDLGAAATFDLSSATYTKNGESDTSRQRVLIFSNTHASGTAITIPSVEKWYFVRNSGAQAITLAPSGGSTATVAAGADAIVFSNGTNAYLFRQRLNELAAPNGPVAMNSQKITGLADGTDPADAVNKAQVAAMTAADVQRANEWADKTTGFVEGSENSAKSWAVGGTGDGDPVAGSAKEWATSTSTVDGGLKGARGYANDAASSAGTASSAASAAGTSATNAYNSEIGASTWATSTSIVSGGFKGARGYAEDAAASKASFDAIWITSASAPGSPVAGMVWFDTSGNVLKVRDATNTVWQTVTGINAASESAAGVIEIADQTETNTGTDDSRAVTPLKLANYSVLTALGSRVTSIEAGLKAGTGISASGASVSVTSLSCDDLLVTLDSVSHNSGSTQVFNVLLSTDGGSTYPHVIPMTSAVNAAAVVSEMILLSGLREGRVYGSRVVGTNAGGLSTLLTTGNMIGVRGVLGGQVNAVRIAPAGGSFDGGTIYVSQRV